MKPRLLALAASLLLGATLLGGCAMSTSLVTGQRRAYAYSWQQEVGMGREADADIVEEYGLYEDPALTAYVARVGEAVLAQSHLRRPETPAEFRGTPFTFRVLDSPIVNAFALPGGYVYVTRGLLAHLENEAQLAVVLGHEVAHVVGRHTSQSMLEAGIGMVGLLGLSLLAEELGGLGEEVAGIGGAAMQLLLFRYSRSHEEESDRLGVEYATLAGYRAAEGAGFFTLLNRMREAEGWFPTFLSTHPDPGRREQTVVRLAGEWAQRGQAPTRVDQDPFYAAIDGMVLGEDPRDGFVDGGSFYHPDRRFRFAVPTRWKVEHEQASLRAADPSDDEVGIFFTAVPKQTSARQAATEYIEESGPTVIRQEEDARNGYRVDVREVEGRDTTRAALRFIEHGGRVYLLAGVAPAQKYEEYEEEFDRVLNSFDRLTDPRVLDVRPTHLRIARADRSAPLLSLLPKKRPRGMSDEDLALLNHLRLEDPVPAGRRLKLPR